MRKKLMMTALFALLVTPTLLFADPYAGFYVIPVAGHVRGLNGTMWRSDIAFENIQTAPVTINLVFIQSGENNPSNVFPLPAGPGGTTSVTVPGNGSVLLQDVLNNFNGMTDTIGSILVGSEDGSSFAVTSRSYSVTPDGDTVGQTVRPAANFLEQTAGTTNNATAIAYIPGVMVNTRFRTNLGFVAGTANGSSEMTIQVTLTDAAGAIVGSRNFTIPGGNFTHVQFSTKLISPATFDIGSAQFRILSGNGAVVPYSSVIDNVTADAVFVLGEFPSNTLAAKSGTASVFRLLFDRMTQR